MLNEGSTLFSEEKIKEKWKENTEGLYRRDKRMTDTFDNH